jgi:scyllo-inositol 2-dehydrogenase (NAD+)
MGMGIGLIGAGRMGRVFAQILAGSIAGVDLVAISDLNPEVIREMKDRFHPRYTFTDYHDLLRCDEIRAVVIVTPTSTHSELIQAAAAAGKHIFSEKPLSQSLEQCDSAIAAVERAGVKLQMGFMRRFDAGYALAKQKIEAGEIGRPVLFRATSRDPRRTSLEFARRENSGGLIMDMGVHDFDLARWLMGSEVVRVSSEGACLAFPELKDVGDIDNAVVNLRFANESIGNVSISRNAVYGYDIRTEVLGTEGGLLMGALNQTSTVLMTRQGIVQDTIPYFMERFGEAYTAEIREFVTCVQEDRPVRVTGQDARQATAIAIAATQSLDEGRPVDVPFSGGIRRDG